MFAYGHDPWTGARRQYPPARAQLRITDVDGHRVTAFATNTKTGGPAAQLPDLELRHRRRARCEDRIRVSKDTGLTNLPLQGFDRNRIWCAIVALAVEITAWMQMLALSGHQARCWEPKRLRLRLFTLPATIARTWPAGPPPPRDQSPLGRPRQRKCPAAASPRGPWVGNLPPVRQRPRDPRPSGTGAHPRRHSGHRHTPMTKSPPAGDLQPQQRSTPKV
jgi:Transposase DDE domain group 1